jgi:hypothetical protein
MSRFNTYPGIFVCQTCNSLVKVIRSYPYENKLTWMCRDKHLSTVDLNTKKSRRDFERTR